MTFYKDINKIFLLCGSNNVDKILQVPRNMNNSVNVNFSNFSAQKYERTFQCAGLNVINILPRASYVRNRVITDLNKF